LGIGITLEEPEQTNQDHGENRRKNQGRFYFFAQNGENINYTVLKSDKPKFVYFYSGLVKGKISEITDDNSFNQLTQKGALPGSGYTAKKKDGSETYGP
jgi:hypothetical protein